MKTAVVIPYPACAPELLLASLHSVLAQQAGPVLDVLVVDAGAAGLARAAVDALPPAQQSRVRVLASRPGQPPGAAAARNRALGQVTADTELIAFLGAGDTWAPDHLANALRALHAGHDFYFADCRRVGCPHGTFDADDRLGPARHTPLPDAPQLYKFQADMQAQILRHNVIDPSTVVYRFGSFRSLRFREEFSGIGADCLFWLDLTRLTDRIAFSTACAADCSADGPAEPALAQRHGEMKYRKALVRLYPLTERQAEENRRAVLALRRGFVAAVLHCAARRQPFLAVMRQQLQVDAPSVLGFVPLALRHLLCRVAPP